MNGKTLLGVIFIAIGGLLALNYFNVNLASILWFFLPIVLIVCGIIGLKNGQKIIGSIFLVLGFVFLLSKLSGIILLLLPIVLIGVGILFLTNKSRFR